MFSYGQNHMTASKALAIMRGHLTARIETSSKENIRKSNQHVTNMANSDKAVYGVNTGFGPLCNTKISKENTSELQRKILLSHSVGVGEAISTDIAKLMMILKVHALAKAYSGASLRVLERIIWHIDNDVIPVVPSQGSVGASGDLAPLAHLFLPLIGEGFVYVDGKKTASLEVLKKNGLDPLSLDPKDGLALINGTQFIAAHALMFVERLYNCLSQADLISAMMIEGLMGSSTPFIAALHDQRPYNGNKHVASRIAKCLEGSEMLASHKNCGKVQDPYSLRCIPQVHGASRTAWLHLKELLEIELNSVTDNPLIFSSEFTVSGGNFHGQPIALPIDYACIAAAELGNISDRRVYLSLEGKDTGTPKLLMKATGLNSGFMLLQYTTAALVSENKGLCFPASADSIPTSLGQEDHVSMGSIGARKALRVSQNLENILAIELLCAAQAFDFRRPLKSSFILESAHNYIREHISHAYEDRIFSDDIEKARQIIENGELTQLSTSLVSEFDNKFETY